MARQIYGADGSAQVVSPTGTPTTAAATVKSARTGGVTVTDVLSIAGANLGGVVTPDSRGQVIFQGPDNTTATLWLDFGDGGPRWAVNPVDLPALIAAQATAREAAQYTAPGGTTAKASLPYVPASAFQKLAEALDPQVVPRVASAGARTTAFPAPADGDRCYRTDLHAHQTYRALGGGGRWVTDPALIDEVVLGADASVVTFQNIPQEWRNLRLKFRGRAVGSAATDTKANRLSVRVNNDSTANYMSIGYIRGAKYVNGANPAWSTEINLNGSSGASSASVNFTGANGSTMTLGVIAGSDFATLHGGGEINIADYTNTTTRKPFNGQSGVADAAGNAINTGTGYLFTATLQGGWSSNAAVNRIDLFATGATAIAAGSRFSLYGES